MGCPTAETNDFEYKERDRMLKEQLINGISHDGMMTEIIRELW